RGAGFCKRPAHGGGGHAPRGSAHRHCTCPREAAHAVRYVLESSLQIQSGSRGWLPGSPPSSGTAIRDSSFGYASTRVFGAFTRLPVTCASSISALVTAWPAKWL